MATVATKASLFYQTGAKIQSIFGYGALLGRNPGGFLALDSEPPSNKAEKDLNPLLIGYPRNHNYRIFKKKLLPSFRLYERSRLVSSVCPEKLESFLDIGCCRGFYVINAAQQPDCQISVGIDVHEPFVSTADKVREYLGTKNAHFYFAHLDEVANAPEAYGGPFQTVMLIGTYHYLFWGSKISSAAYRSHRQILARLAQICTNRVIFSARLEINRLPDAVKDKAKSFKDKIHYSTAEFLKSAEEFFKVREAGYLGTYPLFVMLKKNSS